jgi:hypothetical protein
MLSISPQTGSFPTSIARTPNSHDHMPFSRSNLYIKFGTPNLSRLSIHSFAIKTESRIGLPLINALYVESEGFPESGFLCVDDDLRENPNVGQFTKEKHYCDGVVLYV